MPQLHNHFLKIIKISNAVFIIQLDILDLLKISTKKKGIP